MMFQDGFRACDTMLSAAGQGRAGYTNEYRRVDYGVHRRWPCQVNNTDTQEDGTTAHIISNGIQLDRARDEERWNAEMQDSFSHHNDVFMNHGGARVHPAPV